MENFLWFMFGVGVIEVLGSSLVWLSTGKFPAGTPDSVAITTAINTGILVWIVNLLAGG
jgi:hypothetical protein